MLGLSDALGRTPGAPLRVLALGAHPDDIEIGAGGTLRRLVAERPHVDVRAAVFTGADTDREAEARAAAAAFLRGAATVRVDVHGFRDGFLPYEGAAVKALFERDLAPFAPHLVFTHAREDRHQDHRLLSDLAWNTFRSGALVAEMEIPKWDGDLGRPNAYVVLTSDQVEEKAALLLAHFASQRAKPWFTAETFHALARLRGVEAGAAYAEAFTCRKLVW